MYISFGQMDFLFGCEIFFPIWYKVEYQICSETLGHLSQPGQDTRSNTSNFIQDMCSSCPTGGCEDFIQVTLTCCLPHIGFRCKYRANLGKCDMLQEILVQLGKYSLAANKTAKQQKYLVLSGENPHLASNTSLLQSYKYQFLFNLQHTILNYWYVHLIIKAE